MDLAFIIGGGIVVVIVILVAIFACKGKGKKANATGRPFEPRDEENSKANLKDTSDLGPQNQTVTMQPPAQPVGPPAEKALPPTATAPEIVT